MAVSIAVREIIENARAVVDINGKTLVCEYLVTGLDPLRGSYALMDAAAAVPQYGTAHTTDGTIYVSAIEPQPFAKNSRTESRVKVTYRSPSFDNLVETLITFEGTVYERESARDRDGKPIKVKFTVGGVDFDEQPALVMTSVARGLLTFEYTVSSDPSAMVTNLNKLNSSAFRGGAKWTWKCVDVGIQKIVYRAGWRIRLAFEYDENTHLATAEYTLLNGYIPNGIDSPVDKSFVGQKNGYTNALMHFERDFNTLSLPSAF